MQIFAFIFRNFVKNTTKICKYQKILVTLQSKNKM